jgi:hypothetical protein
MLTRYRGRSAASESICRARQSGRTEPSVHPTRCPCDTRRGHDDAAGNAAATHYTGPRTNSAT